jgi:hypothetical protein
MKLQRRTVTVLAIAAALLCLSIAGVVFLRVEGALDRSRKQATERELLDVEVGTLGGQPNPGFEGITAPAVFKGAALFQGIFTFPVRPASTRTPWKERWSKFTERECICQRLR